MATTLTDKENVFCIAVADGKTQYEAFRIAYNPTTENRASIDTMAWQVARKPEIRARIEELRKRRDDAHVYGDINDKNRRIRLIWDRIEACIERGDDAAVARYLDQLAKLAGDYVNVTKDISEEKKPLTGLTDADLAKLIASAGEAGTP